MSVTDTRIEQIEATCDLPDDWGVHGTMEGGIEISSWPDDPDGEAAVELLGDDTHAEVIMYHAAMPGRGSYMQPEKINELEEPAYDIPSQVGVLQFDTYDDAVAAAGILADPDTLRDVTALRSPFDTDNVRSVSEAVSEATAVDMDTVTGTTEAI